MTIITDETLMKFGMVKDENNSQLKEIFKNNSKLKEVHIDTYPDNPLATSSAPFMLLLRAIESDVSAIIDEDRLILKRNDKYGTYFMNVLFSKITECYYKISNDLYEFILNVQNVYYRITIFN